MQANVTVMSEMKREKSLRDSYPIPYFMCLLRSASVQRFQAEKQFLKRGGKRLNVNDEKGIYEEEVFGNGKKTN